MLVAPAAHASLQDQINAANAAAAASQQQASNLHAQGDTLANKLASLQAQAASISAQLNASQAKQVKLTGDMEATKQQIVIKKQQLDENVRTIYQQAGVSPIEMLASSKNFSEYVDRQQYMDRLKDHVQEAAAALQVQKADLEKQQAALTVAIKEQADLSAALASQQQQQAALLASTRGQEAVYAQQAGAANAEATRLKAQQAAALTRSFGSIPSGGSTCGGGYPGVWCNAEQDSMVDSWGMYNRECVSYTAFKVASSGRFMPYGLGNANQWPGGAAARGISVDGNPRVGDVAILMSGPYGHAMYVESVSGGNITVSQYNYGFDGRYSTMTIPASGLRFIHF